MITTAPQHPRVRKVLRVSLEVFWLGRLRDAVPALSRGPGDQDTEEAERERGGGLRVTSSRGDGQGCDVTELAFAREAGSVRKRALFWVTRKSQVGSGGVGGGSCGPAEPRRWAIPDSSPPGAAST